MLVIKPKKALVLNLRNQEKVKTVIPTAKNFTYKGRELLAIPHRLDEVRVLRNIGISAPSPIEYYYRWPARFSPMAHQITTAAFLTLNPRAYCLNEMGTGKTMSILWAADYLRSIGVVRKVLIVAPLSTLERVWADEIFTHFPHLNWAVLHGSKDRRTKLLKQDVDVYIINHDGLGVIKDELAKRKDIDLVVIDELATYRNARTERFTVIQKIVKSVPWVWGATGSPIPNSPTDAYAQCRLITPDAVPKYFGQFRDMVMKQVSMYKWEPRASSPETVHRVMQPAIRFKRSECIDLPPTLYQTRHVEMTKEQKTMYEDMLRKLKAEHADGQQIMAVNEAVKTGKLMQIAAGVAYGPNGDIVIGCPGRVSVVQEIVESAEGKVIVYVPLIGALNYVADILRKAGHTVEIVHGGTPKNHRNTIFANFQKTPEPRVLVAHPECMAHGLTLTSANTVVWYIPPPDNEIFEQASMRIPRPGQKLNTFIIMLEGTQAERVIYKRLQARASLQGSLLELVEDSRDD